MLLYLLMVLCAAGMIYANGQAKTKGVTWGKPLAGLCGMMAVMLAFLKIAFISCAPAAEQNKIIKKELHYVYSQNRFLGDYIGKNFAGEKILLIANPPSTNTAERHKTLMDALKEGLDGRASILAEKYPSDPEAGGADEGMSYEYYFTAEAFTKMRTETPEATMIVSLIGLPYDFEEMEFWTMEEETRPKMMLVNANIFNLKKAMQGGFVQAVLHYKPNLRYDINEEPPSDWREAFAKRYIIIDGSNLDAISSQYPNLFKPDEDEEKPDDKPEEGGEGN